MNSKYIKYLIFKCTLNIFSLKNKYSAKKFPK